MDYRTLDKGTILHGRYEIEKILGKGGFGITYLAKVQGDTVRYAVKEYYPAGIVKRQQRPEGTWLYPLDESSDDEFQRGKRRFLKEAKTLKEFASLEGIVTVIDYFEEGNTAYLVMEYIDGITLKDYVQSNGTFLFSELFHLLRPLMQSLMVIHAKGYVHRDISPDNIIVGMDNQLHLIDFGAAKETNVNENHTMTVILKSGYAPPEQYLKDGKQGAWTDVYGLCATMYMALSGKAPQESIARFSEDKVCSLYDTGIRIEEWQSKAIARGMSIKSADRYRDMESLYQAFITPETIEKDVTVHIREEVPETVKNEIDRQRKRPSRTPLIAGMVMVLGIVILAGAAMKGRWFKDGTTTAGNTNVQSIEDNTQDVIGGALADNTLSDSTAEEMTTQQIAQLLTMPDVTGKKQKKAKEIITALDSSIEIKIKKSYSSEVAKGKVISQSVLADTMFNEGTLQTLTLTVSKGTKPVTTSAPPATSATNVQQPSNPKTTKAPAKTTQAKKKESEDYSNIVGDEDYSNIVGEEDYSDIVGE